MTTPDAPNIEETEPPSCSQGPWIDIGKTEDGQSISISDVGDLFIGDRLIDPESITKTSHADDIWFDGMAMGIAGESIRRCHVQLKHKTITVRHITSNGQKWWDADDTAARADKHIESGLWTPGKN